MSKKIKDRISLNNVKEFIEYYLENLYKEGFTPFQEKPTVEIFPKRKDLVGIVLLDEKNSEIICRFVDEPRYGNDYLFLSTKELKEEKNLQSLGESYAYRKAHEMRVDNAYSINLERVDNLLKDGHYAVALVFLVSAFENMMKELFLLYNELWFLPDDDYDDEIYIKIGVILDSNNPTYKIRFPKIKQINGRYIGIEQTKIKIASQWKNVKYWEQIHKICKKLGVYDLYILKKQGNNGLEIGKFEILKGILEKLKVLNFQRIFKKGGTKNLFEMFYNISLDGFKKSLIRINNFIEKRHNIIHGTLKDDHIEEQMVLDFRSLIQKLVSYIRDELDRKHYENLTWGVQ